MYCILLYTLMCLCQVLQATIFNAHLKSGKYMCLCNISLHIKIKPTSQELHIWQPVLFFLTYTIGTTSSSQILSIKKNMDLTIPFLESSSCVTLCS